MLHGKMEQQHQKASPISLTKVGILFVCIITPRLLPLIYAERLTLLAFQEINEKVNNAFPLKLYNFCETFNITRCY